MCSLMIIKISNASYMEMSSSSFIYVYRFPPPQAKKDPLTNYLLIIELLNYN